jgi:hypothetical protein
MMQVVMVGRLVLTDGDSPANHVTDQQALLTKHQYCPLQ